MAAPKPIEQMGADIEYRMDRLADGVMSSRIDTIVDVAQAAKRGQLQVMRPDSGGDLKLSGVGKTKGRPGNTPIGVKTDVTVTGGVYRATIDPEGPVHLLEADTSGHVIRSAWLRSGPPRGFIGPVAPGQLGGSGRRAVLNLPFLASSGNPFRASARHPGTKGKQTWTRGRRAARPLIERVVIKNTNEAVKRST